MDSFSESSTHKRVVSRGRRCDACQTRTHARNEWSRDFARRTNGCCYPRDSNPAIRLRGMKSISTRATGTPITRRGSLVPSLHPPLSLSVSLPMSLSLSARVLKSAPLCVALKWHASDNAARFNEHELSHAYDRESRFRSERRAGCGSFRASRRGAQTLFPSSRASR